MRSERLTRLYNAVRDSAIGGCVSPAVPYRYRVARTLAQWETLESMGLVRLRCEADYDAETPDGRPESEAYGSVGEFRLSEDDDWTVADSVWGHVGYRDVLDWRGNVYIPDVMGETVSAFRDARVAVDRSGRGWNGNSSTGFTVRWGFRW